MIEIIGGPDRDRTGDLFHAMEARSQLRHRPTLRKDFTYSQGCRALSQSLDESEATAIPVWSRRDPKPLTYQSSPTQMRVSICAPMGTNSPVPGV